MITSMFVISVDMNHPVPQAIADPAVHSPSAAPPDTIGVLISDAARLLRRRFDARARSIGVSRAQWQVLIALSRSEGINQAALADRLEVETITVARMVDRL
ncbi:MAG: MarR family transcriptional regulator, partial [Sandarakinorhabdus sp.]|nr:MarR family transcriptional regulator [Sandarakinorhabdus sp.]